MLFDENFNDLIQLLGKYDEAFHVEYEKFIARFPEKLIDKASKGKEFSKITPKAHYAYLTNSRITKFEHNLSILDKNDAFSSLNVYPQNVRNMDLGMVNPVLSLSIGHIIGLNSIHSFNIYKESGKNILMATFDKDAQHKHTETIHELTDEEFEFILKTISNPFENKNNIDL